MLELGGELSEAQTTMLKLGGELPEAQTAMPLTRHEPPEAQTTMPTTRRKLLGDRKVFQGSVCVFSRLHLLMNRFSIGLQTTAVCFRNNNIIIVSPFLSARTTRSGRLSNA